MNSEIYITLKIKSETAKEFRTFSRKLGKQQTDSLQLMLNFFHVHALSPMDELGPNFVTLEKRVKTRIDAVVAIIRDIEKTQTKPTLAMLQLLFQQSPAKQNILVEKKLISAVQDNSLQLKLQKRNHVLQNKLHQFRELSTTILNRVAFSRSSFGQVQLRLMMTQKEFEDIKLKLEDL